MPLRFGKETSQKRERDIGGEREGRAEDPSLPISARGVERVVSIVGFLVVQPSARYSLLLYVMCNNGYNACPPHL